MVETDFASCGFHAYLFCPSIISGHTAFEIIITPKNLVYNNRKWDGVDTSQSMTPPPFKLCPSSKEITICSIL